MTIEHFKPIRRAIEKHCQGYTNLTIIRGRPGIGKSFNIERFLKKNKADYTMITHISEAYLYRCLYENNGRIIWLKDFSNMLRSLKGIEELKAASESKAIRTITNYNYSIHQLDLPKRFNFTGSIIIDCNNIDYKFKEDIDALISRADYLEFALDFDSIKSLMFSLCRTSWQKDVTKFLIDNFSFVGFNELNLRTQHHSFNTYMYAIANGLDWKEELKQELTANKSKIRNIVYSVAGNKPIKTTELKKYLIRSGICSTLRTADRRISDWLALEEIYKVSSGERDFLVCLNPMTIEEGNETTLATN